ncbi:transporter [Paraglaciecola aquimarina]|uniref:Transporter n=1 Tax=Paraglaciecola aquimarina TaxID=1235557 RepID=A0ABU3SVS9_9ALTE|nr:transporter [Paraglaciecola aquimarina]MDU0354127.1 transporter [Paraglaciecola aquimarina]
MLKNTFFSAACVSAGLVSFTSHADVGSNPARAIIHAPIGVMGDHLHAKGEFMFSYRLMNMQMSGNIQGSDSITDDAIATTVANPYANPPMSPPTVRVVPQDMSTQMHMLGFMYAPSDNLTLMAMINYLDKNMTLTTYQGAMGTNTLGDFDTTSSGLADSKLALLYRLYDAGNHHLHGNFAWIIPTGSEQESAEVLTPMNSRMTMRLPYGMQLSSGSHQGELGITYNGFSEHFSWGAQGLYTTALEKNEQHYKLGDKLQLSAWTAYEISTQLSTSARLKYSHTTDISGADAMIQAPVTTANPDNYGGELLDLAIGINSVISGQHRVAFEYQIPLNQNVNGVQMEMDYMWTLGYQVAF